MKKNCTELNLSTILNCNSIAEIQLYKFVVLMDKTQSKLTEVDKDMFIQPEEQDNKTGEIYAKEIGISDITDVFMKKAMKNLVKHGYKPARKYDVYVSDNIVKIKLRS